MHPTHYCTECGALWRQCDDGSWNLRSETAGPCCDNAAMGEQIKPLATPSAQAEPLRAHLSRARAMMQAFCDRVEVGQVRSVKTYSAFKAFLEETKP